MIKGSNFFTFQNMIEYISSLYSSEVKLGPTRYTGTQDSL